VGIIPLVLKYDGTSVLTK